MRVFADTSFYVALLSLADAHHASAVAWSRQPGLQVVTTEFVLVELGNYVARGRRRGAFGRFLDLLLSERNTTIVPASHSCFDAGAALYRLRSDKDWSLTDCTSFVVMEQQGLTDALTADRHFEQAGYRVLLN